MLLKYLWKTFCFVACTVGILLFVRTFVVDISRVNGISMFPNLHDGQIFLVNKYSLLFTPPARQQVVQSRHPLTGDTVVKRIVGIPGDTVHIAHGVVTVTTEEGDVLVYNEWYLMPNTVTVMWANEPGDIHLGRDEYYVLGDNRRESTDSRHYGPLLRKDILGTIIGVPDAPPENEE